ncbi:DNA methylase N-4/N-6 [Psychrobacillus sp. MER TA 171]|uniref:DNA methylase N-4/N-6 n=1 Tax=Psychrobacillus sp. MER TA 171 TaxID=2939577 RepID=UPI0020405DED|nr:DNA methylase N-4/N-6 [Psychrobacillus sp. MER TA 171]MCM3358127.1 DNA methylase N-4/N-6 [Psychrobacillus sp. MER TA 171]
MQSIVSYPDRGKWGNNKYKGNCTGYLIKDLLNEYKPKFFVEVFAGGGTGFEVARSLGYQNSIHLDLNGKFGESFNILTDEIPSGSDFVFSHPPYHTMHTYSGEMWGSEAHPDDLSRCSSYEEFIYKMNICNSKIYNSLLNGGRHAMLIGDMKLKGKYYSMIKDLAWYGDIDSHIIKEQHNFRSQNKNYNGKFIPIVHEHLLVFKKNSIWSIPVQRTMTVIKNLQDSTLATWRDLVQAALQTCNGKAKLADIYNILRDTNKAKRNPNFEAKVRQILQLNKEFTSVERGVWMLAAA